MLKTFDIVREKARSSQRPRISVFDFDNTCLMGDCGALIHCHISRTMSWNFEQGILPQITDELGRARIQELLDAYRRDVASGPDAGAAKNADQRRDQHSGQLTAQRLYAELVFIFPRYMEQHGPSDTYAWATGLYAGLAVDELRELARDMIRDEGQREFQEEQVCSSVVEEASLTIRRGLRKRPAIAELIEVLSENGVATSIVSASNEWTVKEASRWTGVPLERVYGNRAETLANAITSNVRLPVTWGPGKVTIAQQISETRPLLAIGDSRTDKELLDYAEHAVLIDCGDAELAAYGRTRGWSITPASSLRGEPLTIS